MNLSHLLVTALSDAVWSALAAAGFAVLFNVPRRLLFGCLISGAVGHTARTILIGLGLPLELSTLAGAALVGFLSLYLAHVYQVPASIFTVTGAIPMVPGVFAYQTMIGLLSAISASSDQNVTFLTTAAINGVRTAVILGALVFGIASPTLIFRRFLTSE